ncbi:T-box protein h15 [Melipona bicolor]|uniref:T-box protein h15 n=1 Tax=Melipona bicolor TaxID=60889 RepID=A0AA40G7C3_9HYME|nr:T-box protein h15 [Melipona bicolor]
MKIVLNSMHRYQPRIHLVRCRQTDDNNLRITDLQKEEHKTFVFPEAIFTAVTAYQNQLVSMHMCVIRTLPLDTPFSWNLWYTTRTLLLSNDVS